MKTVSLLRHAKSSWDQTHLPDHLRPLAPRGRKAAPRMGKYMAQNNLIPDRVLCSTAQRALETWNLVSEQIEGSVEVEVREDLYHASPESLLHLIQDLPDSEVTVLLVGHNPTMEDLAFGLAGGGDQASVLDLDRKYPTGGLAVIDFAVDSWSQIRAGIGYLRLFIRPRSLES